MKKPRDKRQTGNTARRQGAGGKRVGWAGMIWRYMLAFTDWPQWLAIGGFVLLFVLWLFWRHLVRLVIGA